MNQSTREVLLYLLGNENIEAIILDDLQKLADENPYFPVAQFLLAKKLKAETSTDFLPQAQKTALYFSNPYWLHYQLTSQLTSELWQDTLSEKSNSIDKEIANDRDVPAELSDDKEAHEITAAALVSNWGPERDSGDENIQTSGKPLKVLANEVNTTDKTFDTKDAELVAGSKEKANQPEEEMAAITRDTDAATEGFLNEADTKEDTIVRDDIGLVIMETQIPASAETTEVLEEMAGVSRETDEVTEAFLNEVQFDTEENAGFSSTETETPQAQAENNPPVSNTKKENKKDENGEPDEHERMFQNIKAMLDATSEEADADTENAVIPIDPYYTIDYFASQGIKLELEQNPWDQLGQHLKKFTHWLKHMKKLGPEDATEVISRSQTEADIPTIAESSNTVREVVTEAMASVLEKQGKKDKAIELYKKLSFLNPDKSAYFAGKIKNLKGI
ncbi:MAG: hypothetical protein WKG06_42915 [Segetibacter sp.]